LTDPPKWIVFFIVPGKSSEVSVNKNSLCLLSPVSGL